MLGLFLLGPHVRYPVHGHAAQEVYLVVQGEVEVQRDGVGEHVRLGPGRASWHGTHQAHSARTGPVPVLMAYARRGQVGEPGWYAVDPAAPDGARHQLPVRTA